MSIFTTAAARQQGWGARSAKFATWMNDLDTIVKKRTGLSIHDFPDWDFASSYQDEGATPKEAADDFINDMREEGYL